MPGHRRPSLPPTLSSQGSTTDVFFFVSVGVFLGFLAPNVCRLLVFLSAFLSGKNCGLVPATIRLSDTDGPAPKRCRCLSTFPRDFILYSIYSLLMEVDLQPSTAPRWL